MLSVRLFIKFDFPKFHNILKNRSIHLYFNLFYLTVVKNRTYCVGMGNISINTLENKLLL